MALARAALATDFTDAARLGISPPIKSACPGTMPHEDYMAGLAGPSPVLYGWIIPKAAWSLHYLLS